MRWPARGPRSPPAQRGDGSRETVPISALAHDDIACVAVGEVVPADGLLLEAGALRGSPADRRIAAGATSAPATAVYAGTVCREQPARLRVTETGSATRLSQLARLVEQAQAQRPALARGAERIARHFVAGLLLAALRRVPGLARLRSRARLRGHPGPAGDQLPLRVVAGGAGGAGRRPWRAGPAGRVAVRDNALDRLARATDIVFDKTGTLSDGRPLLAAVEMFAGLDEDRACASPPRWNATAAIRSRAPSLAFAPMPRRRSEVRAVPGRGIEGVVDGQHWRLGQAGFAAGARRRWPRLAGRRRARRRPVSPCRKRSAAMRARRSMRCARRAWRVHLSSGDAEAAVRALRRPGRHRRCARAAVAGGQARLRPWPAAPGPDRGDGRRRPQRRAGAGRRRCLAGRGRRRGAGPARRRPGPDRALAAARAAGDRAWPGARAG